MATLASRTARWITALSVTALSTTLAQTGRCEESFYSVRVADVELTEGKLPEYHQGLTLPWSHPWNQLAPAPYVALDGEGESYVALRNRFSTWSLTPQEVLDAVIVVQVPNARAITGRLYLPTPKSETYAVVRFRIPAERASADHRQAFYAAKINEMELLLASRAPGGAWFRHEIRQARRAMPQAAQLAQPAAIGFPMPSEVGLDDTYALLSGGRAMRENLALDRGPETTNAPGAATVELTSLQGITVAEIDWKSHIAGKHPQLDPLAQIIPADQHAVFFPTLVHFLRTLKELQRGDLPIAHFAESRVEDVRTIERYARQLGISLDDIEAILADQNVKSVALTGSDPYFRVGTDVGVLLETAEPVTLAKRLWVEMQRHAPADAERSEPAPNLGADSVASLRTHDRQTSGYVATFAGAVLLANSPVQVERVAETAARKSPALAGLDEFVFFRDRYPHGEQGETALAFLSDATIRRWCGPRWRVAASRRIRDAAVMADLQASYLEKIVPGNVKPGPIYADLPLATEGEFELGGDGVRSSALNTLAFQTPIAEMSMGKITPQESEAYQRWRDGYQRNWRWAFDPIAIRLTLQDDRMAVDMTVMPLIAGTEYQDYISITQGGKIPPDAADPHDALAHFVLAINRQSSRVRQYAGLTDALARGLGIGVLDWLGDTASLYFDHDPIWEELSDPKLDERQRLELLHTRAMHLPLAVRIDSTNNLKLAAFLAAARAYIEQTAPGLTTWESLTYHDQAYVKIGATPQSRGVGVPDDVAIFYGMVGRALVVSLDENVMKRAIDRQIERQKTAQQQPRDSDVAAPQQPGVQAAAPSATSPWLGENLAVRVDGKLAEAALNVWGASYGRQLQRLAWSNLPILNAWRRLFPDRDPVQLHETYWHARLVCPGGGQYVWNDEFQTMESTMFGSPANPRLGPRQPLLWERFRQADFGLTFEDQGLRARVQLVR